LYKKLRKIYRMSTENRAALSPAAAISWKMRLIVAQPLRSGAIAAQLSGSMSACGGEEKLTD
jgi:hypothetical protein